VADTTSKAVKELIKAKRQAGRIPLLIQFTFFVILTIGTIMALTTWLTYRQQQKSLRDEVVKRGATIARSLASSAGETMLDELTCATLVHDTMPNPDEQQYPEVTFEATLHSLVDDITGRDAGSATKIIRNAGVVEVIMVDANNEIKAHNNLQMLGKPYQQPKGTKPYQGEDVLVQTYAIDEADKRFDFAVPIMIQGGAAGKKTLFGVVHLGMSQKIVDNYIKQATMKLLIATGFVLWLGAIVAILLAQYLTQPIKTLVGGVLAIASGDLNQEIKVTRKDELGELTLAFNEMAASLREKELIKGAFSTYVSSQVMDEVLKDPGRLALGGARKKATMVFTDIRGFTSMSETLEPEDVVSVINVYLSVQTEIILRNGGMLDKFVGDCVMAVFGTPISKPDDSLRAVKSALEIQQSLLELNQARKMAGEKTVTIGIGINTGDVVSGNMGSAQKMDYTVIGDSVNLAARLESIAEGGSILISENTYMQVKDHIEADKLSPLAVKGKKEKVLVYSVKSLKA
jgi:adenylate cyclase